MSLIRQLKLSIIRVSTKSTYITCITEETVSLFNVFKLKLNK